MSTILQQASPADSEPSDYEHDVFLSYTHDLPFGPWVRDTFFKHFESLLRNELAVPKVRIFYDRTGMGAGTTLTPTLARALALSKCMVSVWSPDYFNSQWCKAECCVMLRREEELGYRTVQRPDGLVIPVQVFSRDAFPKAVREVICFDCVKYMIPSAVFEQTNLFADFYLALRDWVQTSVGPAVKQARPWKKEWLHADWSAQTHVQCQDRLKPEPPVYYQPSIA